MAAKVSPWSGPSLVVRAGVGVASQVPAPEGRLSAARPTLHIFENRHLFPAVVDFLIRVPAAAVNSPVDGHRSPTSRCRALVFTTEPSHHSFRLLQRRAGGISYNGNLHVMAKPDTKRADGPEAER